MGDVRIGFAREMARSVLRKYQIIHPPIDVTAIAQQEQLTVRVMQTWPAGVSGLLLRDDHLIGLNGKHSLRRRRFSLAHELGHWFMRHDLPWHDVDVSIDNPPSPNAAGRDSLEGEADEFAGELLVPRSVLKQALKGTADRAALAELFGVSEEALWVRLLRHRLI
jgi:Zn-dependent peptidase ImmA (M78 family)